MAPEQIRGQRDEDAYLYIYDPTNGTKSQGMIIRTNKGQMDSPDLSPEVGD